MLCHQLHYTFLFLYFNKILKLPILNYLNIIYKYVFSLHIIVAVYYVNKKWIS
jgi:hypothetical protein